MKRKKENIFDVGEDEIKRKKENATFYCGEKLLAKFDKTIKTIHGDVSRSSILRLFMKHYTNNPGTFEQLFWELEKPKTESEV